MTEDIRAYHGTAGRNPDVFGANGRIEKMNEKILILEAEDIEDELIKHIDEVLKENDPDYIGLRYADGNYINYVFKA